MNSETQLIHVYKTNSRFEVTIDPVEDGERDKQGVLTQEGGVNFRSDKGTKFFLKFSEFAFVFAGNQAA